MQRLLVIFALGLVFLLPGCAVQNLPFSGASAAEEGSASPYSPQPDAVHDGQSGTTQYYGQSGQSSPMYAPPPPAMPGGPGNNPSHGAPSQSSALSEEQGSSGAKASAAPKPITHSPSGLKEREL